MQKLFLAVSLFITFCSFAYGAEMQYAENNGAYWYIKTFETEPEFDDNEKNEIYEITSLKAYNSLSLKNRRQLEYMLTPNFMQYIKKANTSETCWFINEPERSGKLNNNFPINKVKNGYRYVNALGWAAVSLQKDKAGINLWLSMMKMSEKAAIMQNIPLALTLGVGLQKHIMASLNSYLEQNGNEETKASILNYLSKIPDRLYNLKDIIETQRKYTVVTLNHLERNIEGLAKFFGSDISPKNEEIQECHKRIEIITSALKSYLIENVTYRERDISKLINKLTDNKLLLSDEAYDCPLGIKREIEWIKQPNEDIVPDFNITCGCEFEFPAPKHPDPDSPSMVKARAYRNTIFETHKQQVLDYWNKLADFDYSSNPSTAELQKLFNTQKPEFRENVLMLHLGGIGLTALQSSLDDLDNTRNRLISKFSNETSEQQTED